MEFLIVLSNGTETPSDMLYFFGRLHPLVVHLPIGFLLLAVIVHFASKISKFKPIKPFVKYLWGLGGIGALIAVIFGYLLSLTGNYDQASIFWHKWSGIAILLLAIGCLVSSTRTSRSFLISTSILAILLTMAIFFNGHLGGGLTHGSSYLLEYAPNTIRSIAGLPPKMERRKKVTVLDSADIYLDVVSPILYNNCTGCHNTDKRKGKLLLTSYKEIIKGGENGEVIFPGDATKSELFRRISLPLEHEEFMPSDGKRPLSDLEVVLIEGWINSGALPQGYATSLVLNKTVLTALKGYLGLDKNIIISTKVAPPRKAVVDSLKAAGFVINTLMRDNHLLEGNFSLSEKKLKEEDLDLLLKLKEQLIWLDLSGSGVEDQHLIKLGQLDNLLKLDLSVNPITDNGLRHLLQLSNLELLNLYGTEVSDKGLVELPKLPALRTIYLWQTKVSDIAIKNFIKENSQLKIISERVE